MFIHIFFSNCQAWFLVLVHGPGQIQKSWSKKDQSWSYNPNEPTHHHHNKKKDQASLSSAPTLTSQNDFQKNFQNDL